MIKKKYLKSRNVVKLTFEIPKYQLPKSVEVDTVYLVGDFNDWDQQATKMNRLENNTRKISIEVPPNMEYQFRYLANGAVWFNDWDADQYAPGQHGDDNCIVIANKETTE